METSTAGMRPARILAFGSCNREINCVSGNFKREQSERRDVLLCTVILVTKFPETQLISLLHDPNAKMRAGHMPAVDISTGDMSHLLAYLGVLGTSAANVPSMSGVSRSLLQAATKSVQHNREEWSDADIRAWCVNQAVRLRRRRPTDVPAARLRQRATAAAGEWWRKGTRAIAPLIAKAADAQTGRSSFKAPNAKMKAGGMPARRRNARPNLSFASLPISADAAGTPQPGEAPC